MAYLLHDSTNNSDTDMSFVSKVFMNKSIKNTLLFSLSLLLVVSSLIVSNMFQQLENSRANTTCEQICDKFVAESVERSSRKRISTKSKSRDYKEGPLHPKKRKVLS